MGVLSPGSFSGARCKGWIDVLFENKSEFMRPVYSVGVVSESVKGFSSIPHLCER